VADRLQLEVVTPQRRVVDLQVDQVELPGALGELGVLPGHTPLLTALGVGTLTYRGPDGTGVLAIGGGFAEILGGRVTVLAEVAETPEEIDLEAARSQRAEAEEGMKTASADEAVVLAADLRLAETRLEIGKA